AYENIKVARLLIHDAYLSAAERLKNVPGISKITTIHDENMLHFGVAFEFKNIKALNQAMEQVMLMHPSGRIYFRLNQKGFIRTYLQSMSKLIEYYKKYDDSLTKSFDLDFFTRNMRYIIRYSFGHQIHKAMNPLATISK